MQGNCGLGATKDLFIVIRYLSVLVILFSSTILSFSAQASSYECDIPGSLNAGPYVECRTSFHANFSIDFPFKYHHRDDMEARIRSSLIENGKEHCIQDEFTHDPSKDSRYDGMAGGHKYYKTYGYPRCDNLTFDYVAETVACKSGYILSANSYPTGHIGDPGPYPSGCVLPTCPDGQIYNYKSKTCIDSSISTKRDVGECNGENGCCPLKTKNPIHIGTGNKFKKQIDIPVLPLSQLGLTRYYNSHRINDDVTHLGEGWRHTFDRSLRLFYDPSRNHTWAELHRHDGKIIRYEKFSVGWTPYADIEATLDQTPSGNWLYTQTDGTTEEYSNGGQLLRITDRQGINLEMQYNTSGQLIKVTDSLGRSLDFGYYADGTLNTVTDHASRTVSYVYDGNGNLETVTAADSTERQYHYEDTRYPNYLTGITDERGVRYQTYAYDDYDRAYQSELANGVEKVTITFNADATRTVTDSRGNASQYTTREHKRRTLLEGIQGPGCSSCGDGNLSYQYDSNNDLTLKTENGVITEYGDYNGKGEYGYMIEGVDTPTARRIDFTYDDRFINKVATRTEPSVCASGSKVTTYSYDDSRNTTSIRVDGFTPDCTAISRTTTLQYNGPHHQLSQIDGPRTDMDDSTDFSYYPDDTAEGFNRARLKSVTGPTGIVLRGNIDYTATGKVSSEDRPNGLSLQYEYYAGNDRLKFMTETDGGTARTTYWTYLPSGEVQTITTAYGTADASTLTLGYDDARRLVQITDGLGNSIKYTLDTEGNREKEEIFDSYDVLKKSLIQTFDAYNRLNTTSQANESSDSDFSADGSLDKVTDGNGSVSQYGYDELKRLTTVTQDVGGSDADTRDTLVQYGYDVADRLNQVTDANGNATTYVYDDLGNLLSQTSPDTGSTQFTYDDAGNVKTRTDAKGQLFSYSYDALNRLELLDAPGFDDDVTYTYDLCINGSGRLCAVIYGVDGDGNDVTYDYNVYGDVTNHQGFSYDYDNAGRLSQVTYPSGAVVQYLYDAAGQVRDVTVNSAAGNDSLASNVTYEPFGGIKNLTYPDGTTLNQNYDQAYRLASQAAGSAINFNYDTYDANGNLTRRTDNIAASASTFGYDALNRLGTAEGHFGSRSYDYDRNGNRISLTGGGGETYTYQSGSNRLSNVAGSSVTMDANGNILSMRGLNYGHTPNNRIASVSNTTSTLASYRYNGLGQRTDKTAGSEVTRYGYGLNGELLAELDSDDVSQVEYVYLNGQPLAMLTTATTTTAGGEEIIQDNGTAGTSSTGTWSARTNWRDYGSNYLQASGGSSTYRWTPSLTSGSYEVYAWWVSGRWYSNNVPVTIQHAGITESLSVNQRSNGGQWVLLGTYDFTGSGGEYVEFSAANGYTTADAVRFVKVAGTVSETRVYSMHNDHLGTPWRLTDDTGTVVWSANYDPFGQATVNEDPDNDGNPVTFNLRFPGQYYDKETGLHYNYFRYYDPASGRYMSSDPIGLDGGMNTYGYVGGNPVRNIDPKGLYQMCHRPVRGLPGRHCYGRFSDGSTLSFYEDGGVRPEDFPNDSDTICTSQRDSDSDNCIKKEMEKCKASNYDYFKFNCCHCLEEAMKACDTYIPTSDWPNYPINPGPRPGEPGYSSSPIYKAPE